MVIETILIFIHILFKDHISKVILHMIIFCLLMKSATLHVAMQLCSANFLLYNKIYIDIALHI